MNTEEIFQKLAANMVKGLMFHSECIRYYRFLGLEGYAACHEHHFAEEADGYHRLQRYYTEQYERLIPTIEICPPCVIPESWYRHCADDLTARDIRQAVEKGYRMWLDWETSACDLYRTAANALSELREPDAASFVETYIQDVRAEIRAVKRAQRELRLVDYDVRAILDAQHM